MNIIPAIDLRGGLCVRLRQGNFGDETIYSDDPVQVAVSWREQGATLLHVVDLDGARSGAPVHSEVVREICCTAGVLVQVGGGIRTPEDVENTLSAGAWRVVLGTAALEDPSIVAEVLRTWPGRIAVSLDARRGLLTTRGWLAGTDQPATTVASSLAAMGVRCLIYTDIGRDGTLCGPNLEAIRDVQSAAGDRVEIIASGGIGSLADLRSLRNLGVSGAIVGRALYTGDVTLAGALELEKEGTYGR